MSDIDQDEQIKEAKEMIVEAVKARCSQITRVKPPNPSLAESTAHTLDAFGKMRGAPLFFPFIGTGLGNGSLVQLIDESVKYDFITGIGVHGFGHSHPDIIRSSIDAAISDVVMEGHLQQNQDAIDLTKLLIDVSGMDHCFLSSTGVMANENAFKICFQKKETASRILAFDRCFLGRTIALSQVTDKPQYRIGIPLTQQVDYIPFYDHERPDESTKESLATLHRFLDRYPGQHAAMTFELIQGEGGFNVGHEAFFKALMTVLKDHNVPIIADEVQTFGRTSRLFAFQHFGLEDLVDVVTIGKLSQACATLFKSHMNPAPGLLSQTFTTSASAIRASKVIIKTLISEGHFGPEGKNMQLHKAFTDRFEAIRKKDPSLISGPYGIGGMIAFTPLDGSPKTALHFVKQLFEAGVMSFLAGKDPMKCRFLIPLLAIKEDDIDKAMEIVEQTLVRCQNSL